MVLLLKDNYGRVRKGNLSVTHREYRHARRRKKPVFAFLIGKPDPDKRQRAFIAEVEGHLYRSAVRSRRDLQKGIRTAIQNEFVRCFRDSYPPIAAASQTAGAEYQIHGMGPGHGAGLRQTQRRLANLYTRGRDMDIQRLADECERKFPADPLIRSYVYMAEVNVGLAGGAVAVERVRRGIRFWRRHLSVRLFKSRSLLYCLGNAFLALGRPRPAIRYYRRSLREDPNQPCCLKNMGTALLAIGDVEGARGAFHESLVLDPAHFESLYCLATLEITRRRDYAAGLSCLERIRMAEIPRAHRTSVKGWMAIALGAMGRHVDAVTLAEEAISDSEVSPWVWGVAARQNALAWRADRTRLSHAIEFFRRLLKTRPDDGPAWADLGYALQALARSEGRPTSSDAALDAFRQASVLKFEDGGLVWDKIGHVHQDRKEWERAEQAYRKAAEIDSARFGYCHGVSLISLQRFAEALPLLRAAAETHQPDAMSWFQVGLCSAELGQLMEAESAYKKAIRLDPEYPNALIALGGLYWNQRLVEQAAVVWREAVARFPEHPGNMQIKQLLDPHGGDVDQG